MTVEAGQTVGEGDLTELLEASARGDRAAFSTLYQLVAPKLFGVILRITSNRAVAEEVLQNAFIRIWQNADRFSPSAGRPIGWLIAVARNAAIDQLRSERTERRFTIDTDKEVLERLEGPSLGDGAEAGALRHCLQQLEKDARSAVVLAYCWGSSREELATHLGRPVNTIKTLLHRSLKSLSKCLESE